MAKLISKSDHADEIFRKIVKLRAERLGISEEEVLRQAEGKEPLYLIAAKIRAAELGISAEELLAQDLDRLCNSYYPGPECIESHEIEAFLHNNLPPERIAHTHSCSACYALLYSLKSKNMNILGKERESGQN